MTQIILDKFYRKQINIGKFINFCHKFKFSNSMSLQTDDVNLSCFKPRL